MDRRKFIKVSGIAALGTVATACGNGSIKSSSSQQVKETSAEDMTYRINPKNGEKVSLLGYGCMRWQMKPDENGKNIVDQDSVNELVDYALAHGVNYFDSSPVYLEGQSEKSTGIALARHPRESYLIATKLSNFSNYTRENSILMYRKSFENFQTDYIDYYLLHSIGRSYEDFERRYIDNGMLDFLLEEREKGHIRNLGFSFHGNQAMFDRLLETHEKYHWDFVQIQMNYQDWTHASGRNCNAKHLYDELYKRNIPAIIMEPLLGGRLARLPEHVVTKLKTRNPEASIASWAFRFNGTYDGVLCVLSGMTYMEHLKDNLHSFSPLVPLNQDELDFLEETADLLSQYPTIPCNDCKYCMPCPYGIDIPAILLHYNKCVNEGLLMDKDDVNTNEEQKAFKKARRSYLISYDRAVDKVRQADHCIKCGECVKHCPQNIPIPRRLKDIATIVENLKTVQL